MPSETSAVNAAYIEARMKQFKLVDMREQYQELIRVASEQSMTYEDFLIMLLQAEETGKGQRLVEAMDAAIKVLKEQPEMRRAVGMLMNDEEKKIFAIQQLSAYPNCELTKDTVQIAIAALEKDS